MEKEVHISGRTFGKGFISAVIGGLVMTLVVHQCSTIASALDVSNVVVGGGLLGGVAYMVGFIHGRLTEREEGERGQETGEQTEKEPGFTK